jgi:hypothetical protein
MLVWHPFKLYKHEGRKEERHKCEEVQTPNCDLLAWPGLSCYNNEEELQALFYSKQEIMG